VPALNAFLPRSASRGFSAYSGAAGREGAPDRSAREACADGGSPLPCLNSHNGDGLPGSEQLNSLQGSHRKTAFALTCNTKAFVKKHGIETVGFVTLTFPDHVTDPKECSLRFKNFNRRFLSGFKGWIAVRERTKRGRLHLHLLLAFGEDIRTGIDWQEVDAGIYRSANAQLRKVWSEFRAAAPRYGFGRTEVLPIKSNVEGVSRYVGKYIAKNIGARHSGDVGARLVNYSKGVGLVKANSFAWNSPRAWLWRAKGGKGAEAYGLSDLSELKGRFGSHWAHSIFQRVLDQRIERYPTAVIARADGCEVPDEATDIVRTIGDDDVDAYIADPARWLRELAFAYSSDQALREKAAWEADALRQAQREKCPSISSKSTGGQPQEEIDADGYDWNPRPRPRRSIPSKLSFDFDTEADYLMTYPKTL